MFIPDPNFFHPGSRVKKVPGSRDRIRISIKELSIWPQDIVSKLSEIWSGKFIPDPDLDLLPIQELGVKKSPDPGSGSAAQADVGSPLLQRCGSTRQRPGSNFLVWCWHRSGSVRCHKIVEIKIFFWIFFRSGPLHTITNQDADP